MADKEKLINPVEDLELLLAEKQRRNPKHIHLQDSIREKVLSPDKTFPKQKDFVLDQSRFLAAQKGRRGGGTWGVFNKMAIACFEQPGVICPYIATTARAARRIIYPVLVKFEHAHQFGIRFNKQELIAYFPTGSQINLFGADEEQKRNDMRGSPFKVCAIDEAAFHGSYLEEFIDGVLTPSTIDYDGQVVMISNPNPQSAGYFFDITTDSSKNWSVHKWNILDNTFIPHAKKWLDELRERKGWDETHPTYMREWLGHWSKDEAILIFPNYTDELNATYKQPQLDEDYDYTTIGIDFAYHPDTTAFCVLGFTMNMPYAYILESVEANFLTINMVDDILQELETKYSPMAIKGDAAGGGKQIIASLNERRAKAIEQTDKREKRVYQDYINDDFRLGYLKIYQPSNVKLIDQIRVLQRDVETGIDDERFENNLTDAMLYAYRASPHYAWKAKDTPIKRNTDEYMDNYKKKLAEKLANPPDETLKEIIPYGEDNEVWK
ncbi:MAG: hypothetical protein GY861_01090 [bacterium]|nr:hypothetical protein [bacterium]